jgi:hypothetical protein
MRGDFSMAGEFVWVDLGGFRWIKWESKDWERPNLGLAKQTRIARIDTNWPGFLTAKPMIGSKAKYAKGKRGF